MATMSTPARSAVRSQRAAPPTAVASVDRVSKRFGPVTALDDVSFALAPGRIAALLGPNGAGKTTAVRILLGLTRATRGTVTLFGRTSIDLATRARIGVLLQVARVPHTLTVVEHVRLFSSYYPAPLAIDRTVAIAGLGGLEHRRYGQLSGGQQQRLLFALAICGNPDLLVLDEPTTSLDIDARRALWSAVRTWAERGASVLLTTHDLAEAEALSDDVVVLSRGRVVRAGTTAELTAATARAVISCVTSLPLDQVRRLPGVAEAERVGRATRIATTAPEATTAALLQRDTTCAELEISRARLEDAFLALTRPERSPEP